MNYLETFLIIQPTGVSRVKIFIQIFRTVFNFINKNARNCPSLFLEIEATCGYSSSREATESAKYLLKEIAQVVVRGDLESKETSKIGEKIILLKSALSKLKASELKQVAADIVRRGSLKTSNEDEKVKR